MKKIFAISFMALAASCGPSKKATKKTDTPVTSTTPTTKAPPAAGAGSTTGISAVRPNAEGFLTNPNNLEYKIVRDATAGNNPQVGDYLEMHIKVAITGTSVGDSTLYDSRQMMDNKPVPYQLTAPTFKGDLPEGLMMLTAGDSAIFRMPVDSIPMNGGTPPWLKPGTGQKTVYTISMVSVKSQEQMRKDQEAAAAQQIGIDDKIIQDYLAKNKIKATKTASGLYYKIDKVGTGENAKAGQKVTVNYTGKTLDGKTFDSNVDPAFQHVQPFSFSLGQGQVIRGWDEGIQLLKKGGKGTLYIPSTLAYGAQGAGGSIKPNAVLMFDVEITDIAAQ